MSVEVVRTVVFRYEPTPQILKLLSDFRDMINFCIRKALETGSWNIRRLHHVCYPELKAKYSYNVYYYARAYRIASQILTSWRKKVKRGQADPNKPPQAKKLFVRLHKAQFKLEGDRLRVAIRRGQYATILLQGGDYQARFLERYTRGELRVGEITINERYVYIPFIEEIDITAPSNYVSIDINEGNITMTDNDGNTMVINTKALRTAHATYQNIRRRIQALKNPRTKARLLAKYRGRERRKVRDMLHKLSKAIVKLCDGKGIVLEDLKGIKRQNKGRKLNRRLNNSWNPRQLQFYITYKALLAGLPVYYVNPARTSKECPLCGGHINSSERACNECGLDRDVAGAVNILYRFWCPEAYADEGHRAYLRMRGAQGPLNARPLSAPCRHAGKLKNGGQANGPHFSTP